MQVQKESYKQKKRIVFDNKLFQIHQQKGKVFIVFNDTDLKLSYTCDQYLQKISLKTIISALRSQDQPIVRAFLIRKSSKEYHLVIKVAIQFLNQIQQILIFKGQKMSQQAINKINKQKQYKGKVKRLQKEVIELLGVCSESGMKVKDHNNKVQINLQVPFDTTIYSISLNFNRLINNLVRIRFYYWDKVTNTRIQSNQMPLQGIYASPHTQFSLIGHKTSFSKALLIIEGDFQSLQYNIKQEKVIRSQPIITTSVVKNVMLIGVALFFLYLIRMFFQDVLGQLWEL